MKGIYEPFGILVPVDGLQVQEKLYDLTGMAVALGVLSARSGKAHAHAIGAIINLVGVMDHEKKIVPFINNGHSGTTEQYMESVLNRIRNWLKEKGYPTVIQALDGTNYKIIYREAN